MEPLNSEEYQAIRDADKAMGEGPDALQLWPVVYTQRRALITTVEALEEVHEDHRALVRELDVAMNGPEGSAAQASLCDLVAQFRKQLREHAGVFYSEPPPADAVPVLLPCCNDSGATGFMAKIERTGEVTCVACGDIVA